jgi:hypothetical protein
LTFPSFSSHFHNHASTARAQSGQTSAGNDPRSAFDRHFDHSVRKLNAIDMHQSLSTNDWLVGAPEIFSSLSNESYIFDDATEVKRVEQTQCRGCNRLRHTNGWTIASEQQGLHAKFNQPNCSSCRCGSGAGNDYVDWL